MTTSLALGIDAGGTNIRLAVVNQSGSIIDSCRQEARLSQHTGVHDAVKTAELVLDLLVRIIRPMLVKYPTIQGVGIGFPGFFDTKSGLLLSSPNIPGLYNFPLGEHLGTRLGLPVHTQNDASLAALGEFRFGAGKSATSLLHLTLGTGVGGGVIIDSRLYGGDGGMAMEVGHLHIAPEDRICGCGARGCLESWASASAVAERFSELSGIQADAREVCRLADTGNEQALAVLGDAGSMLGRAIAEISKLLDIRRVSISGGLTGAWHYLAPAMHRELDARLIPPLVGKISIRRSCLGDDAGILGAADMVFEQS